MAVSLILLIFIELLATGLGEHYDEQLTQARSDIDYVHYWVFMVFKVYVCVGFSRRLFYMRAKQVIQPKTRLLV